MPVVVAEVDRLAKQMFDAFGPKDLSWELEFSERQNGQGAVPQAPEGMRDSFRASARKQLTSVPVLTVNSSPPRR
jgi:hypothetical protein